MTVAIPGAEDDSVAGEYNSANGRFSRRDDASGNIEVLFNTGTHLVRLTPDEAKELADLLQM